MRQCKQCDCAFVYLDVFITKENKSATTNWNRHGDGIHRKMNVSQTATGQLPREFHSASGTLLLQILRVCRNAVRDTISHSAIAEVYTTD